MTTWQNQKSRGVLEYLTARNGLEVPACLRKVQHDGTSKTYTAVLETEETDTGATVRLEIAINWARSNNESSNRVRGPRGRSRDQT